MEIIYSHRIAVKCKIDVKLIENGKKMMHGRVYFNSDHFGKNLDKIFDKTEKWKGVAERVQRRLAVVLFEIFGIEVIGNKIRIFHHFQMKRNRCFNPGDRELAQSTMHSCDRIITVRSIHDQFADH